MTLRSLIPVLYDVPISGRNDIDSLLGGRKWGAALGLGVSLTYSFPEGDPAYPDDYGINEAIEWMAGWQTLDAPLRTAFRDALNHIASFIPVSFTETAESFDIVGDLRFAASNYLESRD